MHLSRCYVRSKTLSCQSCHDPHAAKDVERDSAHYNTVCATCHATEACRAPQAERAQTAPADNCIHCHMRRVVIPKSRIIRVHASPDFAKRIGLTEQSLPKIRNRFPHLLGELSPFLRPLRRGTNAIVNAFAGFGIRRSGEPQRGDPDPRKLIDGERGEALIELHESGLGDAAIHSAATARLSTIFEPGRVSEFAAAGTLACE